MSDTNGPAGPGGFFRHYTPIPKLPIAKRDPVAKALGVPGAFFFPLPAEFHRGWSDGLRAGASGKGYQPEASMGERYTEAFHLGHAAGRVLHGKARADVLGISYDPQAEILTSADAGLTKPPPRRKS
jgi:hypothetical protein